MDIEVTPEEATAFIIPVMLAAAAAMPKDASLIHANFTPRKLLERQNVLSMGVPSVLLLALTLSVLYLGMDSAIRQAHENRVEQIEMSELERQIMTNQAVIDSIRVLEGKIAAYEQKNYYVQHYIGDNNQWHYILSKLSECFQDRPLTWATNIRREEDTFRLEGSTSDRQHVIAVSELFPNTLIKQITEKEIESYTVWDFDITCSMPDHLKTLMSEVQPQRTKIGQSLEDTSEGEVRDDKPAPVVPAPAKPVDHTAPAGPAPQQAPQEKPTLTRVYPLNDDGTYTVRQGDNLYRIAVTFGTTMEELQRLNGMDTTIIYPGQKIVLPQGQ